MSPLTRPRFALIWALRILPPLVILGGALEFYVRHFVYDTIYRDNDCIAYAKPVEDAKVPRRSFLPNCRVMVESPGGLPFEIRTNEDGLRDRPREEFRDGVVALLGDSHVEGFAFPIEQSLGRRLEALAGARFGKVLNLGFRGTGPSQQLQILERARSHYKVKEVIWVLTENDILDEYFFHNRPLGGWLGAASSGLQSLSQSLFQRRYYTLEWLRVLTNSFAMIRATRVGYDSGFLSLQFCDAIGGIRKQLPSGTPVHLVAISHGAISERLPYFGASLDREAFWQAMSCAGKAGFDVINEKEFFSGLSAHFLRDRYHLDPAGTDLWAKRILTDLKIPSH